MLESNISKAIFESSGCLFNEQCADHGFPYMPGALAYDAKLSLLAIGTKSGALRVYPSYALH